MSSDTYYAERFKVWQSKICGRKPTKAELAAVHATGKYNKPGAESLAAAMMLREGGATAHQIKIGCNAGMARNKVNTLATNPTKLPANPRGLFTWAEAPNVGGHKAYHIKLSANVKVPEVPVKPVKAPRKVKQVPLIAAPVTPTEA